MFGTSAVQSTTSLPIPQPIYDDFYPMIELVKEPSYYILHFYLPKVFITVDSKAIADQFGMVTVRRRKELAFNKEDLNVIIDHIGKITVRGRKRVGANRFARFESSYNVPNDSDFEKISGKLENNILAFTIPKSIAVESSEEKNKGLILLGKQKIVTEEMKEEEEPEIPKKKPIMAEEERKEAVIKEKKEEQIMNDALQNIDGKMKEETLQKEETTQKKEEPAFKEKSKNDTDERKEEEAATLPKEKPTIFGEKRKESIVVKAVEKIQQIDAKTTEEPIQKNHNTIKEKKPEIIQIEDSTKNEESVTGKPSYFHETGEHEKKSNAKESRKRSWLWTKEDKGCLDWLGCAFVFDVLSKVYKNKMFICLALVAFSIGFYISRILRRESVGEC